jgi:hypothetical protein
MISIDSPFCTQQHKVIALVVRRDEYKIDDLIYLCAEAKKL